MIKKLTEIYCLILCAVVTLAAFLQISSLQDTLFPLLLLPLDFFFLRQLLAFPLPETASATIPTPQPLIVKKIIHHHYHSPQSEHLLPPEKQSLLTPEILTKSQVKDLDRRLFLKLIGSAGLSAFILSLFTQRAHAAFFGSVPGPGTVSLKDSLGTKIDPAEKQPTDGYKIAQLDDTSDPDYAYYGFLDKNSNWYIQRETLTGANTGTYLYAKGSSGFSTAWTNRGTQSYNTFDSTF